MKQKITIDHIGIAAKSLNEGSTFWRLLGLMEQGEDEVVEDQGVITRFFPLDSKGVKQRTSKFLKRQDQTLQ